MREKAFIIHVRGNEERELHIKNELASTSFDYQFIENGNKEELKNEDLKAYFTGDMLQPSGRTSCAYKHLLAYKMIVENQLPYACIIEDDIIFTSNFNTIFSQSIKEFKKRKLKRFLISFEDSLNLFIRRSEEEKDQLLYKQNRSRFAGLYMIDLEAAKLMLAQAKAEKIGRAIDWWHNDLINQGSLNVYWCHPTIARQMSHNGKFGSLIDDNPHGPWQAFIYTLKLLYKNIRQVSL